MSVPTRDVYQPQQLDGRAGFLAEPGEVPGGQSERRDEPLVGSEPDLPVDAVAGQQPVQRVGGGGQLGADRVGKPVRHDERVADRQRPVRRRLVDQDDLTEQDRPARVQALARLAVDVLDQLLRDQPGHHRRPNCASM